MRPAGNKLIETRLDLAHRNMFCPGQMPLTVFGRFAHVDDLIVRLVMRCRKTP